MTAFALFTPLPNTPQRHLTYSTDLEGQTYRVRLDLNRRDGFWYFGLTDAETTEPIVQGVRLSVGIPVNRFPNPDVGPPGQLYLLTAEGSSYATLENITADTQLFYYQANTQIPLIPPLNVEAGFFDVYKILTNG